MMRGYSLDLADDGSGILVWAKRVSTELSRVLFSRYTPQQGWTAPAYVDNNPYNSGTYPVVRMGPGGTATAAWASSGETRVLASVFQPGSGWGASQAISPADNPAYTTVGALSLAVGGDGSAMVVWDHGPTSGTRALWRNHLPAGGTWGTAQRVVELGTVDQRGGVVVMDDAGNALLAWRYNMGQRLLAKRYVVGTGWDLGTTYVDDVVVNSVQSVSAAMTPDGRAVVVWAQGTVPTASDAWANSMAADGTWSGAVSLESRSAPARGPGVVVDAQGNALAAWHHDGSGAGRVTVTPGLVSGGWQAPVDVDGAQSPHYIQSVTCAMSRNGTVLVVWRQGLVQDHDVYAVRSSNMVNWGRPLAIESGYQTEDPPVAAMDHQGNAVVAWGRHSGGGAMMVARVLR
jgi:hypothetical protein